jgi:hypothetical protein
MYADHSAHSYFIVKGMILFTAFPGALLLIMFSQVWGGIALAYTLVLVICSLKRWIFIFSDPADVKLNVVLLPYGLLCIGVVFHDWEKWNGVYGYLFLGLGGGMLLTTFISGCMVNRSVPKGILALPAKGVMAVMVISMGLFFLQKAKDTKRDMNRRQWGSVAGYGVMAIGAGVGMVMMWRFLHRLMPNKTQ